MRAACAAGLVLLSLEVLGAQLPAPLTFSKHVLAWADVRNGYQHESITHALGTVERLGWESGLYDTIIRTDSQSITKSPILFKIGTGIATGEQSLARNLNYFDAIFFFGVQWRPMLGFARSSVYVHLEPHAPDRQRHGSRASRSPPGRLQPR